MNRLIIGVAIALMLCVSGLMAFGVTSSQTASDALLESLPFGDGSSVAFDKPPGGDPPPPGDPGGGS